MASEYFLGALKIFEILPTHTAVFARRIQKRDLSLCLAEFSKGFSGSCYYPVAVNSPPVQRGGASLYTVYTVYGYARAFPIPVSLQSRPFRFAGRSAARLNRRTSLATWCTFACVHARRMYLVILIEYRGILRADDKLDSPRYRITFPGYARNFQVYIFPLLSRAYKLPTSVVINANAYPRGERIRIRKRSFSLLHFQGEKRNLI